MLKTVSSKHDETSPSKALTNEQKQQLVEKTLCMTRAQALKDAVMARNIADNLTGVFIHINGNYHSDCGKGIITYLKEFRPAIRIITVSTVYQDKLSELNPVNRGKADFYIVLPTDTHKTF